MPLTLAPPTIRGLPISQQIVLISSIGHSGSTVLDLALGAHTRCTGLGEVQNMLTPKIFERWESQPCGCGKSTRDCSFWGPLLSREHGSMDTEKAAAYARLAQGFSEHFGPDMILLDSSKGTVPFKVLAKVQNIEVKVVHLIRDVRSWATSQHRRLIETSGEYRSAPLRERLGRRIAKSYFILFRDWYRRNRQIQDAIKSYGWPAMTLGYEPLALSPHTHLPKLCAFLGIDYTDKMLVPANSTSHVAVGNMMRSSADKMQRIAYDDRWFHNRRLDLPVACMRRIMRWNDTLVYADNSASIWEAKGQWELQRSSAARAGKPVAATTPSHEGGPAR